MMRTFFIPIVAAIFLNACSNQQPLNTDSAPTVRPVNIELTPDAIPKVESKSRGGNPTSYKVFGKTYHVLPTSIGFVQRGQASWYGTKFHGNKTSNGEIYNMYEMTAAHKSLPIPTYVEVTNLENGKKIVVRVNDRGPFHDGRIIDLSYAAAAKLGTLENGTSSVEIRAIDPSKPTSTASLDTPPISLNGSIPLNSAQTVQHNNSTNQGFLFIQVGAFRTLDNANKLKTELTNALKTPVTIKASENLNEPLYLVRVGPYIKKKSADSARFKLYELGYQQVIYTSQ